jgi:hypothetical protein
MKNAEASLPRRLLWFAALWLAGVIAVGAVAYAFRSLGKLLI